MTPEMKEEARQRVMERLRERHEFLVRHDRLYPPDIPPEILDSPRSVEHESVSEHATLRR